MYVTDYKMLYIYYISVKTPIKKNIKLAKALKVCSQHLQLLRP